MKKFLFFFVVAMLSAVARGEVGDTFTYEGLNFRVLSEEEHTVEVGPNNDVSGDISIPSIALNGADIYEVIHIGVDAFYGCSNLTSVTITDSVTKIYGSAFNSCTSLTSITIPDSIIEIRELVFCGCSSLIEIVVENGNPKYSSEDGVLFNIDKTELLACPGGKTGDYVIPSSVSKIGDNAFIFCSNLTSITIPDSVTEIGWFAFAACDGITSIAIPDSVTEIGDNAFNRCTGLASVTLPNSISVLKESIFYNCSNLTSVTIPNSVTEIGESAFYGCSNLASVTIPNSVTEIGEWAFCYSGLTSVSIPDSVIEIGQNIFRGCASLVSVTIPNSVTTIGMGAFYECSNLASVTIPNSVTKIGGYAFYWCSNLTAVTIPDSVIEIGEAAFFESGLTSVIISDSVAKIGGHAFGWCSSLTSVTIPNSVTEIGAYAFYGCGNLTSVKIPESVTEIGTLAFGQSGLTSLVLSGADTQIGAEAFWACRSLNTIYSFSPVPQVVVDEGFYDVSTDVVVYIPKGSIDAYSNAPEWSRFYDFREMGDLEINLEQELQLFVGEFSEIYNSVIIDSDVSVVSTEFTSSNTAVAIAGHYGVTAVAPGEAEIYFTVVDNYGRSHTKSCKVTVVGINTGVADITADASSEVDVFNLEGREVLRGVSAAELDRLAPGIYIVRSGNNVKKITVK